MFRQELTTYSVYDAQTEPGLASMREALTLLERGELPIAGLVTHQVSLDRTWAAISRLQARPLDAMKQLIDFRLPESTEVRGD